MEKGKKNHDGGNIAVSQKYGFEILFEIFFTEIIGFA